MLSCFTGAGSPRARRPRAAGGRAAKNANCDASPLPRRFRNKTAAPTTHEKGWVQQGLANAPPGLWPLVALTSDGASEEGVRRAYEAIEGRTELSPAERADHLAVLWFVAEASLVPVQAMKMYITEEKLMESSLYKEIF